VSLQNKKADINNCGGCGYCREYYGDMYAPKQSAKYLVCPMREKFGFDSFTAKGRIEMARALLDGRLKYTQPVIDTLYKDLLCGNCKDVCQMYHPLMGHMVDTIEIFKEMRAEIFESGLPVPDGISKLGSAIEREGNIFEMQKEDRKSWITPEIKLSEKADLVYFPGCVAMYRYPSIPQATAKILNKAGVDFAVLGDNDQCCGNPLLLTGQRALAKRVIRQNVENLEAMGAKKVVATCSGCFRSLSQEYPKIIGRDLRFQVVHISQLLEDLIKEGKIKLNPTKLKVTYHDPCELGRLSNVYEAPRNVIKSIPGVELVEMQRNRSCAWCCGAGGGVKAAFPNLAVELAQDRVAEAKETGAKKIVSCCPTCKWNLEDAISMQARVQASWVKPLGMVDLTELVAQSLA
jgi:heterodisulfide reductase subunit D